MDRLHITQSNYTVQVDHNSKTVSPRGLWWLFPASIGTPPIGVG